MEQKKYQQPLGLSFGKKVAAVFLVLPLVWSLSSSVLYQSSAFADRAPAAPVKPQVLAGDKINLSNKTAGQSGPQALPAPAPAQTDCPEAMSVGAGGQVIKEIFDLTNRDREANNLPRLCYSQQLAAAAQGKADDMAVRGYFAHVNLQGQNMLYWIAKSGGAGFNKTGENLAVNFTDTGILEKAWMASKDHRANILDAEYQNIGIGFADGSYDGHYSRFFTVMFGN